MVALVQTRDRALNPVDAASATQVGENQLPPFVRDTIERTVAHTFKYVGRSAHAAGGRGGSRKSRGTLRRGCRHSREPRGRRRTFGRERRDPREVGRARSRRPDASRGSEPPESGRALSPHAPRRGRSDRGRVHPGDGGGFPHRGDVRAPSRGERRPKPKRRRSRCRAPEVEQGRIAVEASSAVEVSPLVVEALSPLDVRELPRQLVLRTSHPILHAFRYVRAEPAPRLSLGVTRHETATVAEAVIDRAEHRTLFTRDGLAVTTSRFLVRNTRKQFLRLALPGRLRSLVGVRGGKGGKAGRRRLRVSHQDRELERRLSRGAGLLDEDPVDRRTWLRERAPSAAGPAGHRIALGLVSPGRTRLPATLDQHERGSRGGPD